MNKKGNTAINLIILLIIAIIVIVIISIFFKTKITEGSEKYSEISSELDNCESFMTKNKCSVTCPSDKIVRPIGKKGWADCKKNEVCCEV